MYRNNLRFLWILAVLVCLSAPALAWDETGHKITAYIAWQRMTPDVRQKVISILTSAPEDSDIATYLTYSSQSEETKNRQFFMTLATWPDIIRDNKRFPVRFKNYAHGDWHYADTFWQVKDGKVVFVEGMEAGGLAMQKLVDFDKMIRGTATDADKAVAIAWLEHLIGDIHQPLHASGKVTDKYPKGDQGGNLFWLTPKGTPADKQEKLHHYWDSIIGIYIPNKDLCDADYLDPIAKDIIKLYPYDKLKDKINPAKYDIWAKESLDLATTEVYKDLEPDQMPSDKYKKHAFEIAQERLALAGYRMGDLFNEVFGAPKPANTASSNDIPCQMIRKVMYPVTQTSSVKQTLEIGLLDFCPKEMAARPMMPFFINGQQIMKEYDVVKVFKTEQEARKYAADNKITDISF